MARREKVGTLRQLFAIRGALRLKAEAELTRAQRQVGDAERERDVAKDTLAQAEAEWRTGVESRVYPPNWIRALGARVVDRDRLAGQAQAGVDEAEQVRGGCETALRFADASEQVAARAYHHARSADARRREERRIIDRPAKATSR